MPIQKQDARTSNRYDQNRNTPWNIIVKTKKERILKTAREKH
jgi:hypothetical protein